MKIRAILFSMLLISFGGFCQKAPEAKDFKEFKWLAGDWVRGNGKSGVAETEHWAIISDSLMVGKNFRLKAGDTVFIQKIKLKSQGDVIYFVADVEENKKPVYFKVTDLTPSSFTCENPKHDFPQKFIYTRDGGHLTATISGDGKSSITYYFTKKQ